MSLDGATLKANAKAAFFRNYWKCVLVGLILVMITGGSSGSSNARRSYKNYQNKRNGVTSTLNRRTTDSDDTNYDFSDFDFSAYTNSVSGFTKAKAATASTDNLVGVVLGALGIFTVGILLVAIALSTFVFIPLELGCKKYFWDNSDGPEAPLSDLAYAFQNNYWNIVKVMFLRMLYVFLWSLLLVVPGIIKSYEYYMVPYLLLHDPDMDAEEAFRKSKEIMDGHKLETFFVMFSFIGWNFLAGLVPLRLLDIFFVKPYMQATEAELAHSLLDTELDMQDVYTGGGFIDDGFMTY